MNLSKIKEIFIAWGISINPNDKQFAHAAKRLSICNECEFRQEHPVIHCTVCGCFLKKKIYSQEEGACPKGKWDDIDLDEFLNRV